MKIFNYKVENRRIAYIGNEEVSIVGDSNVDTFAFTFDSEWEGLTKTLVLINGTQKELVNLINDEGVIPSSIYHNGVLVFGVYGRNNQNEVVLSSVMSTITIRDGAYNMSDNPTNLPDKSTWDRYTDIMLGLVGQGEITLENCQALFLEMKAYYDDAIVAMTQYKNDTEGFKNDAQDILENVQDVKQDIIDMGSSRTFATFYLDAKTGKLYVVNAESLGNMGFFLRDGKLYVSMKTEINSEV